MGGLTWCFDGRFVVICVVTMVNLGTLNERPKMRHFFWIYFGEFRLGIGQAISRVCCGVELRPDEKEGWQT